MTIEEELDRTPFMLMKRIDCRHHFKEIPFNGKQMTDEERKHTIEIIDETVEVFSSGLPLLKENSQLYKDRQDDYAKITKVVNSVSVFSLMTMMDFLVAEKYYLLADKNYDKRFMRGKIFVILNEGFKRLYGFDERSKKKNEWSKLGPIISYFGPIIKEQYKEITFYLQQSSEQSTWWKEERDNETHIDAEALYESRIKDIPEGEVIMKSMKLYGALLAVNDFIYNLDSCLFNYMKEQVKLGKVKIEEYI